MSQKEKLKTGVARARAQVISTSSGRLNLKLETLNLKLVSMPKTFADLVDLMDRLRSPGGCPWDREQTYATLAPMLLEEAYEAFDALEEARLGRPDDLREELGDLLF